MKTQQENFEKIYGVRSDHFFDGSIYLWPNGKRAKPTLVTHAFHDRRETPAPKSRFFEPF